MALATVFGLVLTGAGILLMVVSRFLTDVAANSRAFFRPNPDRIAFKRRNVKILRYMAGAWIVLGTGIMIIGIASGR